MDLAITKTSPYGFDDTVSEMTRLLAAEGFGILTEIDVQQKMREKLDRDMGRYLILGACAPPLAWDAVHAFPEVGVLLPCNVVVYEREGDVAVSAMEPLAALSLIQDETVRSVALEASRRLHRAIEGL